MAAVEEERKSFLVSRFRKVSKLLNWLIFFLSICDNVKFMNLEPAEPNTIENTLQNNKHRENL
jgi:hypothetical protein